MLTTTNTEERIVNLMQQGATITYHYYHHIEFGLSLTKVTLNHHDQEMVISERAERKGWHPDSEIGRYYTVCPVADAIVKRPEVQRGYPGYISDYGHDYRELYEHIDKPAPRWVTEQWGLTEDGQWER